MADELSDFLTNPSGENFLQLRSLIAGSPAYLFVSDDDNRPAELVEAERYGEATDLFPDLMPNWLLSPRVHRLAAVAAEKLGDGDQAVRERYFSRACMRGLLLAGDGPRDLPPLQLGPQDVHPAVQQAAQVRQVGLLLQGVPAQHPQLFQGQAGQPVDRAHVHQPNHLP